MGAANFLHCRVGHVGSSGMRGNAEERKSVPERQAVLGNEARPSNCPHNENAQCLPKRHLLVINAVFVDIPTRSLRQMPCKHSNVDLLLPEVLTNINLTS
jgi:hypothetical protein